MSIAREDARPGMVVVYLDLIALRPVARLAMIYAPQAGKRIAIVPVERHVKINPRHSEDQLIGFAREFLQPGLLCSIRVRNLREPLGILTKPEIGRLQEEAFANLVERPKPAIYGCAGDPPIVPRATCRLPKGDGIINSPSLRATRSGEVRVIVDTETAPRLKLVDWRSILAVDLEPPANLDDVFTRLRRAYAPPGMQPA